MMFKNRILLFLFALSLRYLNAVACATNLHDEILERSKILLIKDATADTTAAYNNTHDPLSSHSGDHENGECPSILTANNDVITKTIGETIGTATLDPINQVTTDNTNASTGTDPNEAINQVSSDPTCSTTVQATVTTDNAQIDTNIFNSTNTSTRSILLEPSQAETSSTFWLYSSLFGFGIVGLAAVFGLIYHRMAKNMAKESMEV